jgi:hypothetical protein
VKLNEIEERLNRTDGADVREAITWIGKTLGRTPEAAWDYLFSRFENSAEHAESPPPVVGHEVCNFALATFASVSTRETPVTVKSIAEQVGEFPLGDKL